MSQAKILANAKIVMRAAMSEPHALPLKSAAAIAGNGWQENLMEPITKGIKDHGSDGLMQWRLSRLDELQRMKDWDTLPVQVAFFKHECMRDYPRLWGDLIAGKKSLETLTANICDIYERPSRAGRRLDARIAYAKRAYMLFDTSLPKTSTPITKTVGHNPVAVIFGILSWIYSALIYKNINIGLPIYESWLTWLVIGVAFFLLLWRRTPSKESSMISPTTVIALFKTLEALVPVLQQITSDIPKIKEDIEKLKGGEVAGPIADVEQNFANLIEKLKEIGNAN